MQNFNSLYYAPKTTVADFFQICFYLLTQINRQMMSIFSQKNIFDFLFYFTINFLQRSARLPLRARSHPATVAALRKRVGNTACAAVALRFQPSETPLAYSLTAVIFNLRKTASFASLIYLCNIYILLPEYNCIIIIAVL